MLTRHSRHAVFAASHFGASIVGCVLTGVLTGAAALVLRARLLNGRRDQRDRTRRFRDVRRVTYGRLLSCYDSQTDLLRETDGLLESLRGDSDPESARAVEGVVPFKKAIEKVEPLALESARASERADQGMKELRSIVVEIEILGARQVLIQAQKLLETVCGAKSSPERLGATSAARMHFVEAADEDVAFSLVP